MSITVNEETKIKAFNLCKDFLDGPWKKLSYDDFDIEPISGGLSNLLYACSIGNDLIELENGIPRKVVLRIYGQIIKAHPEAVVKDSVVFALLAERQMGPKLYGVFNDGRIEEYIKSRHLRTAELHQPNISMECARVMAHFHKMSMPLGKEPTWLFEIIDGYMKNVFNILNSDNTNIKMEELLQTYRTYDLENELKLFKNILKQVESPVVFCHNDMQEGNILIFGDSPNAPDPQLQPIDFEYCSYNYRGFDMGNHFCEWCYNYHEVDEYPFYKSTIEDYPSREDQLRFIRTYISEMGLDKKPGYNAEETEEKILLESFTFALASHFLWGLWSIIQSDISTIEFGYLEYGISRFEAYYKQKNELPQYLVRNAINATLENQDEEVQLLVK